VRRAIEMDGHTVTVAEDGSEALAKFSNAGPFDVLVTDVQMPGLDGISLARKLLAKAPATRIVMMSAYADELDKARGLGAKSIRLLAKPFSIDRIRAEIRALLGA
jgi:DNA-binding response OmpR family regulator